jgi:hypothetical protein
MMLKGILVDITSGDPLNFKNEEYYGDIHETDEPMEILKEKINIFKDKYHGEPKPFLYRPILFRGVFSFWIRIPELKLIMIAEKPKKWSAAEMTRLTMLYRYGNPRATQVNKYHKVWSNAYFFKDDMKTPLTKEEFIKIIKDTKMKTAPNVILKDNPKDMKERLIVARKYLNLLVTKHIVTFETAYILLGMQLKKQYVVDGKPFYQGGACFDAIYMRASHLLKLEAGVKGKKDDKADYLWDKITDDTIYPEKYEEYKEYNLSFKEFKEL